MHRKLGTVLGVVAAAALLGGSVSCKNFLKAENINTVNVDQIDPLKDVSTLSNSSLQDFAQAYSNSVMYQGWFTGEIIATETFADPNDFGRRDIPDNGAVDGAVFGPLSRSLVSSKRVIATLKGSATEGTNLDLARAELVAGYSFVFLAEQMCIGTVDVGPALTTTQMLDSAVAHFTRAITIGKANNTAAALTLANASLVGRARAYLQEGKKPEAIADAGQTPAGFSYNVNYFDDAANRDRVSNQLWARTFGRGSISVAPVYRNLSDPRVIANPPSTSLPPQDGVTPLWSEGKYTSYAAPIRLASKLEADYIAAEAGGTSASLTLIGARRSANGQPAYGGGTDAASVLTELMEQKTRDFFLEGKRLGDFRRNPASVLNLPVPGAPYFKASLDKIKNQTCYPLPIREKANNPNLTNLPPGA